MDKFVRLFRTRYRIVTDKYLGFEAQYRYWWSPLWLQVGFSNTHSSEREAIDFIKRKIKKKRVVSKVEI